MDMVRELSAEIKCNWKRTSFLHENLKMLFLLNDTHQAALTDALMHRCNKVMVKAVHDITIIRSTKKGVVYL